MTWNFINLFFFFKLNIHHNNKIRLKKKIIIIKKAKFVIRQKKMINFDNMNKKSRKIFM